MRHGGGQEFGGACYRLRVPVRHSRNESQRQSDKGVELREGWARNCSSVLSLNR